MEVIPKSIQGHLDMLCNWDEHTGQLDFTTIHPCVLEEIGKASEMADVVIVCPHWGTEYTTKYPFIDMKEKDISKGEYTK